MALPSVFYRVRWRCGALLGFKFVLGRIMNGPIRLPSLIFWASRDLEKKIEVIFIEKKLDDAEIESQTNTLV